MSIPPDCHWSPFDARLWRYPSISRRRRVFGATKVHSWLCWLHIFFNISADDHFFQVLDLPLIDIPPTLYRALPGRDCFSRPSIICTRHICIVVILVSIFLFLLMIYPVILQFHSGCRIWISPKVICLWSLAWVRCETTYYTRSSFLHEFHWVSIKRISLYVVSKFYKYYWIRVTTVMITLRVRYVFWSTFCSMKGGESLDSILFSLRSGKQSTLPNHRYRVWYHIGLRWLASAVWFTSSSTGVYYDEGNSRLFSISACLRGPLLLITIQRKPNPSTSTLYFVVSLSLDHMVITGFYCVWPGTYFGALSTICNRFLGVVSSLNSFNFEKSVYIGIVLLWFWLF